MKIKVFIVEYYVDKVRKRHEESLNSRLAFALGRELARRGLRPQVRRADIPEAEFDRLLVRFEYIASEGRPKRRGLI